MAGSELTWQLHDDNEWRFGKVVRGAVREPYLAEVYYDEDKDPSWVWFARLDPVPGRRPRGAENSFDAALTAAEGALRAAGLLGG
jgi:hypothetical protein